MYLFLLCCLLGGYLLGSLNASIIFGKLFKGIDIRNRGSQNAGMTNTLRIFGKKAAVFVFLFDLLKSVAAVLLARYAARHFFAGFPDTEQFAQYLAGLGSVLGHNFPLYFKFRGGKGILASWGVIMILDYRIALVLLAVFLLVVSTTRYVSLASITSAIIYPLFVIAFNAGKMKTTTTIYYIALSLVISALAVYRHKTNIARLRTGTESKLGQSSEKKE